MSKIVLYLNEEYIQTIEQLRGMMRNLQLINNDSFRKEILSAFRDKVLERWLLNRGKTLYIDSQSSLDDDAFIALYKEIVGETNCPNFHSDFSTLGEFLRCEIDNNRFPILHGEVLINSINQEVSIKFIFKSLKSDNNVRYFTLKDNDNIIKTVECSWSDKTKGKEFSFVIPFNPFHFQEKSLLLVEGKDNNLCRIRCSSNEYKKIQLGGETLVFFYAKSIQCWIGRVPRKQVELYRRGLPKVQFEFLNKHDIESLKNEDEIWDKMLDSRFWVANGQYYNPITDRIHNSPKNQRERDSIQYWVKSPKVPSI